MLFRVSWICGILVLLFIGVPTVSACMCGDTPTVAEMQEDAQTIFVGQVVARQDSKMPVGGGEYWDAYSFTFEVERVWKGRATPQVAVITGLGQGDCGVLFERGLRYLVYGYSEGGDEIYTNICTRTCPLDAAAEDILMLGQPQTEYIRDPSFSWMFIAILVISSFVFGSILTRWWHKSRKLSSESNQNNEMT